LKFRITRRTVDSGTPQFAVTASPWFRFIPDAYHSGSCSNNFRTASCCGFHRSAAYERNQLAPKLVRYWNVLASLIARHSLPPLCRPANNAIHQRERIVSPMSGLYLSGLGRKEGYPRPSDDPYSADDHPSVYFGPSIYLGTENRE